MEMKFRGHETFFIRKGWLSKGMKYVEKSNGEVFISKEDNPMDVLGIGANMVKSLRYWMVAVGLTEEPQSGRRIQTFTELGKSIFEHDRYIEEIGTLQLLQYRLASNFERATAWYYFFNEFSVPEFSREDFLEQIQKYLKMNWENDSVAVRSLNDDFVCIINTYLPRFKSNPGKVSAENNIDCPLGELGLVDILNKKRKTYKKSIPSSSTFDPWVILAIIAEQAGDRREISLNELLTAPCNIGRIFNLDSITMLEILYRIERLGEIKIIRTAGLDVIHILNAPTFIDCVNAYYTSINEQNQENAV